MTNKTKWIIGAVVIVLVVVGVVNVTDDENGNSDTKKQSIGVVAPLTGDSAYYGKSVQAGISLATSELSDKSANFIFEDGGLSTQKSLSAAQKLVDLDGVSALYTVFTNAARPIASQYGGSNILQLYVAAPTSPLEEGKNIFQTAFSYKKGCAKTARTLKSQGIKKVGMLNIESEFTKLCRRGVAQVFKQDNMLIEGYTKDTEDFRTSLIKFKNANTGAVLNVSFAGKVKASVKQLNELDFDTTFVALRETLPKSLAQKYPDTLNGAMRFGFRDVSNDLKDRLDSQVKGKVANYQAAALGYLHAKQLSPIIKECSGKIDCMKTRLSQAEDSNVLGFNGFVNRKAQFPISVTSWNGSNFVQLNSVPQN